MDTLISGATIVTMNERMDVLFGGFIGIQDGKITYIGKTAPEETPNTIVDGTGMVAMPGLINCHTHLAATALRGYLDDVPRKQALETTLNKESKLDSRSAKASALLGIAECLRFGVTSVSDLHSFPRAVAEAVAESGMKANIAPALTRFVDVNEEFDFETDPQCQEFCQVAEKWHGYDNGRIHIDGGIYSEYTSNHKLWEAISGYAAEKQLGLQLHLAETREEADSCLDRTGLGVAELMNCHGVFNASTTATGCVALSDEERKLLGKRKVSAVITHTAYAKAGLPSLPVSETVKAGMNVALGTGSASDCGNLDLFEQMRGVACAQRLSGGDADALPAAAVLMMATVCGARAQGRAEECGMLKEGMDADVILVDFSAPHLMPCHNVLGTLVFGAKGGDVAMTMVRGRILYQNGQFPTLDLKTAVADLMEYTIPQLFADKE